MGIWNAGSLEGGKLGRWLRQEEPAYSARQSVRDVDYGVGLNSERAANYRSCERAFDETQLSQCAGMMIDSLFTVESSCGSARWHSQSVGFSVGF